MFLGSFLLHALIFFVVTQFHSFLPAPIEEPVYYVDVVNLPVAAPQAGSPAAPAPPGQTMPTPKVEPPSPAMRLPQPKSPAKKAPAKPTPVTTKEPGESAQEFQERLAHLEKATEARHESAALDALRKRVAMGGRPVGMPTGTGREAGSDYASYIRSRLVDAFKTTIAYQSKAPQVVVVLTIDKSGRIVRRRIQRTTGDRLFEDSVNLAIAKAEKDFKPPPGGGTFEYGFIFSPQGVGKK